MKTLLLSLILTVCVNAQARVLRDLEPGEAACAAVGKTYIGYQAQAWLDVSQVATPVGKCAAGLIKVSRTQDKWFLTPNPPIELPDVGNITPSHVFATVLLGE